MGQTNFSGPIQSAGGFKVGSATVIDSSGAIIGDIQATAGSIGLTELASAIQASHVPKYAGEVTWTGDGATLAHTVTGAAETDIVMATFHTLGTEGTILQGAVATTNTITFTLDAANTSNDAVIAYVVYRATA